MGKLFSELGRSLRRLPGNRGCAPYSREETIPGLQVGELAPCRGRWDAWPSGGERTWRAAWPSPVWERGVVWAPALSGVLSVRPPCAFDPQGNGAPLHGMGTRPDGEHTAPPSPHPPHCRLPPEPPSAHLLATGCLQCPRLLSLYRKLVQHFEFQRSRMILVAEEQ